MLSICLSLGVETVVGCRLSCALRQPPHASDLMIKLYAHPLKGHRAECVHPEQPSTGRKSQRGHEMQSSKEKTRPTRTQHATHENTKVAKRREGNKTTSHTMQHTRNAKGAKTQQQGSRARARGKAAAHFLRVLERIMCIPTTMASSRSPIAGSLLSASGTSIAATRRSTGRLPLSSLRKKQPAKTRHDVSCVNTGVRGTRRLMASLPNQNRLLYMGVCGETSALAEPGHEGHRYRGDESTGA